MGVWQQVTTDAEKLRFHELLKSCHPVYATANTDGLNRLLGRRRGKAFIYTETDPATFHILLLLTPAPGNPQVWKIVNAVPTGDYVPDQAAKITWRKVREVIDEVGITSFFGTPMQEYEDPQLNAFFREVPRICWELTAEEVSDNGKYRYSFQRSPDRKHEDELFRGPKAFVDSAS